MNHALTESVVRVVNYHNTSVGRAADYDAEFAALASRYAPVTQDMLATFLRSGVWPSERPGVIPAFYNGYRNNYDVARPLLERHGLIGWFFAVSAYSSCVAEDQLAFGSTRNFKTVPDEYPDGRYALSWDELRELDRGHVVASHTRNHTCVALEKTDLVDDEIIGSQVDFTRELGHPVRAFAWLFGGRYGSNPVADKAVDRAGYEFLFSNFAVQRLPAAR